MERRPEPPSSRPCVPHSAQSASRTLWAAARLLSRKRPAGCLHAPSPRASKMKLSLYGSAFRASSQSQLSSAHLLCAIRGLHSQKEPVCPSFPMITTVNVAHCTSPSSLRVIINELFNVGCVCVCDCCCCFEGLLCARRCSKPKRFYRK